MNYVAFSSFLKDLASTETDICQGYQRRFAEYYYNFCLQDEHLKANSMSVAFTPSLGPRPSSIRDCARLSRVRLLDEDEFFLIS